MIDCSSVICGNDGNNRMFIFKIRAGHFKIRKNVQFKSY